MAVERSWWSLRLRALREEVYDFSSLMRETISGFWEYVV